MRETGACLELNTAGWHNKCGEQYPDGQFLKMAAEAEFPSPSVQTPTGRRM